MNRSVEKAPPFAFAAIVVTASTPAQAQTYELELELRKRLGLIPRHVLAIAVADPNGARIGSGGATLNAVLVVSERLCAAAGYGRLNAAYLRNLRILVLHSGGDSQRIPICSVRGKAFCALPTASTAAANGHLYAPIDFLIEKLNSVCLSPDAPSGGVMVAATDVLLHMPFDRFVWGAAPTTAPDSKSAASDGVIGFAIPAPIELGPNHGVYIVSSTDKTQRLKSIVQKASVAELVKRGAVLPAAAAAPAAAPDSKLATETTPTPRLVLLDSGIVYFSAKAAADLLELSTVSPLDSVTYAGLDGGGTPIQFELYTDILYAMDPSLSEREYMSMPVSGSSAERERLTHARQLLWNKFRPHQFRVAAVAGSAFAHLGTVTEYMQLLIRDSVFRTPFRLRARTRSFVEFEASASASANASDSKQPPVTGSGGDTKSAPNSKSSSPAAVGSSDWVVLNGLLFGAGRVAAGAVIEHCLLRGAFNIESGALVSGVRSVSGLHATAQSVIQETALSWRRCLDDAASERLQFSARVATASDDNTTDTSATASASASVVVVFGATDQIKKLYTPTGTDATFNGRPWKSFFDSSQGLITPDDVWPPAIVPADQRTLWTARVFPILTPNGCTGADHSDASLWMQYAAPPSTHTLKRWKNAIRLSLRDILRLSDARAEFDWRARVSADFDLLRVQSILTARESVSLLPLIRRSLPGAHRARLLASLDEIAATSPLDIASRALCTIADVLTRTATELAAHSASAVAASESVGGLDRSGSSRNRDWTAAFELLSQIPIDESPQSQSAAQSLAVAALRKQRNLWLQTNTPDMVIRAARHYDGACQVLVRRCVASVSRFAASTNSTAPAVGIGRWVHSSAPIRFDLAGGWSDTPPISYEHGGAVVNVAIAIDHACPVGASARAVSLAANACPLALITGLTRPITSASASTSGSGSGTGAGGDTITRCNSCAELSDYSNPHAPAALIKCALIYTGVVSLDSKLSLSEQIARAVACNGDAKSEAATATAGLGIEIRAWSVLPKGTGLGGSSILAACVVSAVARLIRREYTASALIHAVLAIEQLMTTGGGWQDQAGGILPGFKLTTSAARLPLEVIPREIDVPKSCVELFDRHMLLLYTGSSRLARNLLQTVIRGWYHRRHATVQRFTELCSNAHAMKAALIAGDLGLIGRCLDTYWHQKKSVAGSSAEPHAIAECCNALRSHVHGLSIGGAGGGGFVLLITKLPATEALPLLQTELQTFKSRYAAAARSVTAATAATATATGAPTGPAGEDLEPAETGADDILQARFYPASIDTTGLRLSIETA